MTRHNDGHPVYGNPVMRYANADDKAALDELVAKALNAETSRERGERALIEFFTPSVTSISFTLPEIQSLMNGFLKRQGADDGATREQVATDAIIAVKLAVAQKRLIDREVERNA